MVKRMLAGLLLVAAVGSGQRKVDPKTTYGRIICVVPMIGSGKPNDPRRPQYAPWPPPSSPQARSRSTILAFTHQVSDDGKSALLELVALDRSAFQAILNDKQVKVFVKGTDNERQRFDLDGELRSGGRDAGAELPGVVRPGPLQRNANLQPDAANDADDGGGDGGFADVNVRKGGGYAGYLHGRTRQRTDRSVGRRGGGRDG